MRAVDKRLIIFFVSLVLIFSSTISVFASTSPEQTDNNEQVTVKVISHEETDEGTFEIIEITAPEEKSKTDGPAKSSATYANKYVINVSLTGSASKVTAKATKSGRMPSGSIVNMRLQSKDSGGSYVTRSSKNSIFKGKNSASISSGTTVTPFKGAHTFIWRVQLNGHLSGHPFTQNFNGIVFNKKAVRYPVYIDPPSRKLMTVPATNYKKVKNPVSWNTSIKNKYVTWYKGKYPVSKKWNWSNYQVHHIKPRAYGGTNSYSNLMPLSKTFHQQKVNSWWKNY